MAKVDIDDSSLSLGRPAQVPSQLARSEGWQLIKSSSLHLSVNSHTGLNHGDSSRDMVTGVGVQRRVFYFFSLLVLDDSR